MYSELHPIIYRSFETMSSHPAARVNESRPNNVTSFDPDTTYTCFLINDAIILVRGGGALPVVWHANDCPQAEMCLCLCLCVVAGIGLIHPALFSLGTLGLN